MNIEGLKIVFAHELSDDAVAIADSLREGGGSVHISEILFPYVGPGFPGHRMELDWEDRDPDVFIFATQDGGDGTLWHKEREYLRRVVDHLEEKGSHALLIMATGLPAGSNWGKYKGRIVRTTLEEFLQGNGGQFMQDLQSILI